MKILHIAMIGILLWMPSSVAAVEDFYLDSPHNKGTLRFEIDNDAIWKSDSNFTNGWSLQYHTVRYASWEETKAPDFIKWVGNHFPTLSGEGAIVRNGHGIGQNMITPEDLTNPDPPPGDLPYAGSLTYTINWQRFNRKNASIFQATAGVLGEESLAEDFQKFVHNDLGLGDDPQGWRTQRDTEPVVNFSYLYFWRLGHVGTYTNGWAGQAIAGPAVHVGNIWTAAELGLGFRFGWNMPEGFNTFPAPPGRGVFKMLQIPKPFHASPHGVEMVLAGRATGLLYSVFYDGSAITSDDRDVEREDFGFSYMLGLNYHYYQFLSIRLALLKATETLKEESLPPPRPGEERTSTDASYGTLMIDFHF